MNQKITFFVILAVVVIAGAFYLKGHSSPVTTPTPTAVVSVVPTTSGSPSPSSKPTKAPSPTPFIKIHEVQTFHVGIQNFAFNPASITAQQGDVIVFINQDSALHTVTSDTGAFDSGHLDPSGQWQLATANMKPGTYTYHCAFHASMRGTIVIK